MHRTFSLRKAGPAAALPEQSSHGAIVPKITDTTPEPPLRATPAAGGTIAPLTKPVRSDPRKRASARPPS